MNVTVPHRMKTALAGVLLSSLAFGATADTVLTLDRSNGAELSVWYRDAGNLRIEKEGQNAYLTSEGKNYVLMGSPDGKKRFAMNMDEFLETGGSPLQEPDLEAVTTTSAGSEESFAGLTGKVYQVEDGARSWQLVVTDDPDMAAITDAVYGAEIRMARMAGQPMGAAPLALELAIAKSLGAAGILKGQFYTVSETDDEALPSGHYQLADDVLVISDWKEMQDAYH